MTRRQTLADVSRARDIRRVQEQAALHALQQQHRLLEAAREERDHRAALHAGNETEWAAVLKREVVDIQLAGLWRLTSDVSRNQVVIAERVVASEAEAVVLSREAWAARLRAADAVDTMAQSLARGVRRAAEERALLGAEDARRFRRPSP